MGTMQDKDFDQLFKDQFADAEITPSANLWGRIAEELEPKAVKPKRTLPVYWMAAACAAVVVSVALLMPKGETIKLQGSAVDLAASAQETGALTAKPAAQVNSPLEVNTTDEATNSTPLVIAPRLSEADVKKDFEGLQPLEDQSHLTTEDYHPASDMMAQLEEKVRDNEAMIASVSPVQEEVAITESNHQAEHRGIRNVGDLVNLVVNKVDKREKKFIQFNTDEDDNSSVIAINIGFLKFNKKDK
jgi:hypothetical protein